MKLQQVTVMPQIHWKESFKGVGVLLQDVHAAREIRIAKVSSLVAARRADSEVKDKLS